MKYFHFLFFLVSFLGFSQIPSGYYDSATGTGAILKTQLFNIINNNTNSLSDANYGDLWTLYNQSAFKDNYYDNDQTIVDLYTEIPSGTDIYSFTPITNQCGNYSGEGDCYNREHVIPSSYFGGKDSYPMYSDAHFVFPSDGYTNGEHGSFPYGVVQNATYTSSNGSKKGNNFNSGYSSGFSGTVFEPIDEFKGDVARAYFYFITCYEDQLSTFHSNFSSSDVSAMFDGSTHPALSSTFLNILLTWNALDPVSIYEQNKNNDIYFFQGNRNPFIDNNDYVTEIWGNPLTNESLSKLEATTIYPNPLKENFLNIETKEILNVEIFNVLGKSIFKRNVSPQNNKINVESLSKGVYLVRLSNEFGAITKKLIKQ